MKKMLRTSLITLLLITAFSFSAAAATISCIECGMSVDVNSKFAAKIILGDTTNYFCDIGDLFSYVKRKGLMGASAQVKDYTTGEWIDAAQASYVRTEKKFKTPMGWGIAAFKDRVNAEKSGDAMDFQAMSLTFK